ncbi:hypothetical protein F511_45994 [Dorcoceras hygrometricum]|uniref:Uncharacterized protein n=1 Tax=Dorcoceras hygrometricum TaxID=472368 RepID=A0A2Z6ZUP8_9LAMI|nr:hypothetical protein F511_45994 [Dorcoceras hygrometricum]
MEKATEACKRKGRKYCSCVGTLQRSVAPKWKEDKIAFWSAEEFWKLSNGKIFTEAIYWRRRPLKKCWFKQPVGATTYCGRITLNIQCTNRGKRKEDEAIDNHSREELIVSIAKSRLACIRARPSCVRKTES